MVFSQYLNNHRILKGLAKALIRLRICAGWSEALLVAHTTLLEISCTGSNNFVTHYKPIKWAFYTKVFILWNQKLRKLAKFRNWYKQVPHLTRDTIWGKWKKKQEYITHKRAKRQALSQHVITRLQGTDEMKTITKHNNKKGSTQEAAPWNSQ